MEPLAGLRILDLSQLLPGAAVTHYFSDFGADVIKIETPPRGDYIREVMPHVDGISLQHLTLDRNKRSFSLDLKNPAGTAVLHALVRSADAVVESSRPGTMARRQADYATLSELNPRIVYLSFTGYGQAGPYSHLPSHGSNLASFAGVNPIEKREDGVIVHGATPYGRYRASMELGALQAAFVMLAALREAAQTGKGRYIDIGLVHALIRGDYAAYTDLVNNGHYHWVTLEQPTPRYAYYECSDGLVILVCPVELRFWSSFCELIGRPELVERGDWSDRVMDFGMADIPLYHEVQETMRTLTRDEWLARFMEAGIPCSPVNSGEEACADPYLGGQLLVDEVTLPTGRRVTLMGPLGQDPPGSFRSRPAPTFGRDTNEVLADFGVPEHVVATARAEGALPAA